MSHTNTARPDQVSSSCLIQLGLRALALYASVKGWIFSPWGNIETRRNSQEEGATSSGGGWGTESDAFLPRALFSKMVAARCCAPYLFPLFTLSVDPLCKNDAINLYCLLASASTSLTVRPQRLKWFYYSLITIVPPAISFLLVSDSALDSYIFVAVLVLVHPHLFLHALTNDDCVAAPCIRFYFGYIIDMIRKITFFFI